MEINQEIISFHGNNLTYQLQTLLSLLFSCDGRLTHKATTSHLSVCLHWLDTVCITLPLCHHYAITIRLSVLGLTFGWHQVCTLAPLE